MKLKAIILLLAMLSENVIAQTPPPPPSGVFTCNGSSQYLLTGAIHEYSKENVSWSMYFKDGAMKYIMDSSVPSFSSKGKIKLSNESLWKYYHYEMNPPKVPASYKKRALLSCAERRLNCAARNQSGLYGYDAVISIDDASTIHVFIRQTVNVKASTIWGPVLFDASTDVAAICNKN